jgi:hypothetical protein
MIKIGFDIGGVLSKYPEILTPFINSLVKNNPDIEVHVLTDMHPIEKCVDWIARNGLQVKPENIHSCDYANLGEECKALKSLELGIDILMDDFVGYVAPFGAPIRLLTMPDHTRPYYHDDWVTDGSEGNFGRRKVLK